MGGNESTAAGGKPIKIPPKTSGLSEADYAFLTKQTGLSRGDIKNMYDQFMANNPDGKLDKNEFARLFAKLRPESADKLDEITQFAFRAFDSDNNGTITFSEFLVAYALTTRGDQRQKLEFAFEIYDADNNGSLDSAELKTVLHGMLDLLGAQNRGQNVNDLANAMYLSLDANHDGRIKKDEFINNLMANPEFRKLMSPFN